MTTPTRAQAAAVREAARTARMLRSTLGLAQLRPRPAGQTYRPRDFHRRVAGVCDDVIAACLAQASPRVALSAPPRHGKSELVGRTMPIVGMVRRPGFSVLYATSTHPRAQEVSRTARGLVEWLWRTYRIPHLAPGPKWTETEWITAGGNGWIGVGVGGATGGIGAHLVVADDTTGSAKNAESAAFRADWTRWIEEDVLTRLMGGGGLVAMETRRGVADGYAYLTGEYGEAFAEYNWPLISTGPQPHDPRAEGEYLWPADPGWDPDPERCEPGADIRYGREWHAANPQVRGRLLAQLYQGHPVPAEGGMLRRAWFAATYPEHPRERARACRRIVGSVDCASSTSDTADWTVLQVWGEQAGRLHLLHEYRERLEFPGLCRLVQRARREWPTMGAMLVEEASSGVQLLQARPTHGLVAVKPHGRSKGERAHHFALAAESGEVVLPSVVHAPWVADTVEEWAGFGVGAPHDDRVDAAAMAAERLRGTMPTLTPAAAWG